MHGMPMLRTFLTAASVLVWCCSLRAEDADAVVPIWPDSPPRWDVPDQAERDTSGLDGRSVADKQVIRLGFVSKPELHVYQPKKNASDTAILVCPGGGYSILAWDLEGTEIAEWLQGIGVTAIVVKYRVPTRSSEIKWLAPVQDIQRSISLVRSGAIGGVSAKRIGVLGFSAGGNASGRVATASKRHYDKFDKHDQASPQPDFAVLVYPAWLVKEDDPTKLIDEIKVTEDSPPMFFAHAADDRINCMSSVTLFGELKRNGVASSLHVFASGGHGFGGRVAGQPTDAWRDLCATWMRSQGWLNP
jgi:endo-1,4-beta-xylanase